MRGKNLVLIVVALAIAGGTALMVRNWIRAERARMVATPAESVQDSKPQTFVLVVKSDIGVGQFVRAEHLRWQPWPADGVTPAFVVQGQRPMEDFIGAVARMRLVAGEPVTDTKVVSPQNAGFLAAVLEPGLRAVSVAVNVTSGISGFVFPGDRVDLVLTHIIPQEDKNGGSNQERRATETVLTGIRVLAIDQKLEAKAGEPVVARTVTFEVTSKQAEYVALAAEMGKLSLALRSVQAETGGGSEPVLAATARSYTLDSDASQILPPLPIAGQQQKVTVFRGSKSEEMKVNGARRQ